MLVQYYENLPFSRETKVHGYDSMVSENEDEFESFFQHYHPKMDEQYLSIVDLSITDLL